MLMQKGKSGEAYNICSGQAYSIREIIKMLSEIAGVYVTTIEDETLVRKVDIPLLVGDYSKIHQDTG
jgi:GDP-4-dehydro-6-deoxy-D-mannose reductase